MDVLVLGSGVIGVTSAYWLAGQGHRVTVVDRQAGPALETSFANAGEVSPGTASPWAAPGLPFNAVKWLMMRHGPLAISPKFDPQMWMWITRTLGNCTREKYFFNRSRLVRLAEYSRAALRELRTETGISYAERTQGTLQLFRDIPQFEAAARGCDALRRHGIVFDVLNGDGCRRIEPALDRVGETIAGGLYFPEDETGDCRLFTAKLADLAAGLGVVFRFDTAIERLLVEADGIAGVLSDKGPLKADAYVVALGSFSPLLLRQIGISIPILPIKGYSITAPILDTTGAPKSTVVDEKYKIAITRLGDHIRVAGIVEMAGYDTRVHAARIRTLKHSASELFGQGGDFDNASTWTGLRPMTPDGAPVIGATKYPKLYLNTGHGTLGWTLACGSAQMLSDVISSVRPQLDISDFAASRY